MSIDHRELSIPANPSSESQPRILGIGGRRILQAPNRYQSVGRCTKGCRPFDEDSDESWTPFGYAVELRFVVASG